MPCRAVDERRGRDAGRLQIEPARPRVTGSAKPRRRYHKAQDAAVVPLITTLVVARPTCGYRRITAILNRYLRTTGAAPVNHKRVYRIMQAQNLRLARHYTERPLSADLRCKSPAGQRVL